MKIAALHLEGRAAKWHQGFVRVKGEDAHGDWEGYVNVLATRFGNHAFDDPIAATHNLRQQDSLQDYLNAFDEL